MSHVAELLATSVQQTRTIALKYVFFEVILYRPRAEMFCIVLVQKGFIEP